MPDLFGEFDKSPTIKALAEACGYTTHTENLERVSDKIGDHVLAFARERVATGQREFRMEELVRFVLTRSLVAPASPDRILRMLRTSGKMLYKVVDRRGSLYRIEWVR